MEDLKKKIISQVEELNKSIKEASDKYGVRFAVYQSPSLPYPLELSLTTKLA